MKRRKKNLPTTNKKKNQSHNTDNNQFESKKNFSICFNEKSDLSMNFSLKKNERVFVVKLCILLDIFVFIYLKNKRNQNQNIAKCIWFLKIAVLVRKSTPNVLLFGIELHGNSSCHFSTDRLNWKFDESTTIANNILNIDFRTVTICNCKCYNIPIIALYNNRNQITKPQ